MSDAEVTVIIPCRNAERVLPDTLAALGAQTIASRMDILVVDNGSTDRTTTVARSNNVAVMSEEIPSAFRARNAGIRATSTPWLAFLDADCVPDPSWLECLLEEALERNAHITSGRIHYTADDRQWGTRLFLWRKSNVDAREMVEKQGATPSGNLLVAREVFDQIGLFNEHPYSSDVAFGRRALGAGLSVVWADAASVRHRTTYSIVGYLKRCYATRYGQEWLQESSRFQHVLERWPWRPGFRAVRPAMAGMALSGIWSALGVWLLLSAERWAGFLGAIHGAWRKKNEDDTA